MEQLSLIEGPDGGLPLLADATAALLEPEPEPEEEEQEEESEETRAEREERERQEAEERARLAVEGAKPRRLLFSRATRAVRCTKDLSPSFAREEAEAVEAERRLPRVRALRDLQLTHRDGSASLVAQGATIVLARAAQKGRRMEGYPEGRPEAAGTFAPKLMRMRVVAEETAGCRMA